MEKRVFLAMVLTVVVFMVYANLNPPVDPKKSDKGKDTAETSTEDSGQPPVNVTSSPATGEGTAPTAGGSDGGAKPSASIVEAEPFDGELVLQSDELRVALDQRGAIARSIRMMAHDAVVDARPDSEKNWDSRLEFVRTYEVGPAALDVVVDDAENLALDKRLWHTDGVVSDGRSVRFHIDVEENGERYRLTKTVSLGEGKNRLGVELGLEALDPAKPVARTLWLRATGGVYPVERSDIEGVKPRQFARSVAGWRGGDEMQLFPVKVEDVTGDEGSDKSYSQATFVADMGTYFGVYLRYLDGGGNRGARITGIAPESKTREMLENLGPPRTMSEMGVILDAADTSARFDLYVGAKDHRAIRESYGEGPLRADYLEVADGELMSQGFCCIGSAGPLETIIQTISKAVVWVLTFFNGVFGNLGVSIIVLTICMRLLMFPVTRRSQVAMQAHSAKMARIKPKLDELKKKHKDQKKIAEEQMKLMREEKVGMVPLGGCLPMFLQIPIFFGLFTAIRFDVDLRHAGFLWCDDLSMPDRVISWEPIVLPCFCLPTPLSIDGLNVFPILMILAMVFHQMGMPKSPDPQMQQQQKMMMFMPAMFGVMLYSYPAGLAVYWLSSSLFGIFEQRVIRKFFPVPTAEGKPA